MARPARSRTNLAPVIEAALATFTDKRKVTARDVANQALPEARKLAADDFDGFVIARIIPLARKLLARTAGVREYSIQPLLRGFEDLPLPSRIAVPPDDTTMDEDDPGMPFVLIHRVTVAELDRNIALRTRLIDGQVEERGKLVLLREQCRRAGAHDDEEIGDVLGISKPSSPPSPPSHPSP